MKKKEKKHSTVLLELGIVAIIFNIALGIINYISCKQNFFMTSCSFLGLNSGIGDIIGSNIITIIGIILIIIYKKKYHK